MTSTILFQILCNIYVCEVYKKVGMHELWQITWGDAHHAKILICKSPSQTCKYYRQNLKKLCNLKNFH